MRYDGLRRVGAGTGFVVKGINVYTGQKEEYVVIPGDISGDGAIFAADYIKIKNILKSN